MHFNEKLVSRINFPQTFFTPRNHVATFCMCFWFEYQPDHRSLCSFTLDTMNISPLFPTLWQFVKARLLNHFISSCLIWRQEFAKAWWLYYLCCWRDEYFTTQNSWLGTRHNLILRWFLCGELHYFFSCRSLWGSGYVGNVFWATLRLRKQWFSSSYWVQNQTK